MFLRIIVLMLLGGTSILFPQPSAGTAWAAGFRDPDPAYSMGVYWWWFGPAVTKAEAARELRVMKEARIGYVLIFPIYALSPDAPERGVRNLPYLSPEFLEVLGYTTAEAKRLGITTDLLLGTGWPYGGPTITPQTSAKRLKVESPLRFPVPEERKRIGEPLPSGLLGPVRVVSY